MDDEQKEKVSEPTETTETDETTAVDRSTDTDQQNETETVSIDLIDKRLQEMSQTIIDTIVNLINPVAAKVEDVAEQNEVTDDLDDWKNLDL